MVTKEEMFEKFIEFFNERAELAEDFASEFAAEVGFTDDDLRGFYLGYVKSNSDDVLPSVEREPLVALAALVGAGFSLGWQFRQYQLEKGLVSSDTSENS